MATTQMILNNRGGYISNNDNKFTKKKPYPKWKKIGSKIFFVFLIIYSLFGVKACSDIKEVRSNQISIEYTVTGHKEYQRKHKSNYHTKRYVFVHNDKLGNYTFSVSPKTYYDVENGQKKMIFSDTYYDLLYRSNNSITREKLKSNYEMFGLTKYQVDNFRILDIFCLFGMSFGFVILCLIYFAVFITNGKTIFGDEYYDTKLIKINLIVWAISLISMFIISIY